MKRNDKARVKKLEHELAVVRGELCLMEYTFGFRAKKLETLAADCRKTAAYVKELRTRLKEL